MLESALPDEMILLGMSYLDVKSLVTCRSVNRKFRELCSRNEAGWDTLCQQLWHDKVFVCPVAKELESSLDAYRRSIHDSTVRQHVLLDELCYDPTLHNVWSFRFKESAGPDWTSWDPWWNGGEARQMVFLHDGKVQQYNNNNKNGDEGEGELIDPPVPMAWRFSARPMDLPERPEGSYIRFTVGGRDVPTYVVRRSPTQNWGFIAESCWGVYTSFRMPLRAKTQSPLRFRPRQWLSGLQNNNNNNHNNDDQEENNDNNNSNSNNDHNPGETDQPLTPQLQHQRNVRVTPLLADDSSFIITNEVQWREALLYNFGATVLPEGESASEDFDRMFGQTLHDRQL